MLVKLIVALYFGSDTDDSASRDPCWSRFLTEDGHLCLDQLLSQPSLEGPVDCGFEQALQSAIRGLAYYNANNEVYTVRLFSKITH